MSKFKRTRIIFLCCIVTVAALVMMPVANGQKADKPQSKIIITGTVTGLDGSPAANTQIFVDSTDTGVTTNDLGKYRVKVNPGAKTIYAWSFMKGGGDATIDGKSVVDIKLDPRKDARPDFSARESNENANATSPKKTKKLNTYSNIFEMIRQEVPGVLVSGSSIVVQQQNSFFGSSAPLYVVNGVRVSSISNINPREVESIVLLKGSQASIYGVEGANGVISITLKTGAVK